MDFNECQERYRNGEWRATLFRDLVQDEIDACRDGATILDIGCGHGFDGSTKLQEQIVEQAKVSIGIEPDKTIEINKQFTHWHHVLLEDAAIQEASIDVAYAVMVLEHVPDPGRFFEEIYRVLKPGGVFWGFSVDRRHYFCAASRLLESLRLKNLYLNVSLGKRGEDRYENYATFYRCNSPQQIDKLNTRFSKIDHLSLSRLGEIAPVYAKVLSPVFLGMDWLIGKFNLPGYLFLVRCEK